MSVVTGGRAQRSSVRGVERALDGVGGRAAPGGVVQARVRTRVPAATPAGLLSFRAAPAALRGTRPRLDQGTSAAVYRA